MHINNPNKITTFISLLTLKNNYIFNINIKIKTKAQRTAQSQHYVTQNENYSQNIQNKRID